MIIQILTWLAIAATVASGVLCALPRNGMMR